jgi:hypothetical protein
MKGLLHAIGVIALVLFGPFVLLALYSSPSLWGLAYVGCITLAMVGLITLPKRKRRGMTRAAIALLVLLAVLRMLLVGGEKVALRTTGGGSRPIDRVLDERDVALMGARVLQLTGAMHDPDIPFVFDAMKDGYDRMHDDAGSVASPFAATYLGLESPAASDVLEMGPPDSKTVVIFLHGFAGSFTLPCWEMGQTVRPLGIRTVCPATSWRGDWWSSQGEAILREVVRQQKERGATTLILSGLSNGGIGASRLITRFPHTFSSSILVSGVASDAGDPHVPTLVVQGTSDAQIPSGPVHAWAEEHHARWAELDAGHFAMLVRHEEFERAVRSFLSAGASRTT